MKCPICKDSRFNKVNAICEVPPWHKGNDLLRYQCQNCGVIFGPLEILNESQESLKQRYQRLYDSGWREMDPTRVEIKIIEILNLKKGQTCLNWGGGSVSKTSQKVSDLGIVLDTYEPFDPYAKKAITKLDNIGMYDAIFSNNLMEHLQDPVAELMLMSNHLKDDGVMIHKTPCWEYVYEWTEYHLFFFVGKSPEIMAEKAGFTIERLQYDCIKFTKRVLNES